MTMFRHRPWWPGRVVARQPTSVLVTNSIPATVGDAVADGPTASIGTGGTSTGNTYFDIISGRLLILRRIN